jgi:hypothetical protein
MEFTELGYTCPDITPRQAANTALAILQEAEKVDAGYLVYLLQNSNLLLLGGLRAQAPYNEFSPDMDEQRLEKLRQLLLQFDIAMAGEADKYNPEPSDTEIYSLFNKPVFARLPKEYAALPEPWLVPTEFSAIDMKEWSLMMNMRLVRMMEQGELPKVWLRDWWAPHNVRFGVLLGYPGPAISSECWAAATYLAEGREIPIEGCIIRAHSATETEVGFDSTPEARKNPEVGKLIALWDTFMGIIEQEYDAQKRASLPAYGREYAALEKFENRFSNNEH